MTARNGVPGKVRTHTMPTFNGIRRESLMALLDGKVAVVTGASSGIGRAIASMFAAHGAAVILTARREALLNDVADVIRQNGGRAEVVAGDVGRPETHEQVIEAAMSKFGGLD